MRPPPCGLILSLPVPDVLCPTQGEGKEKKRKRAGPANEQNQPVRAIIMG